MITGKKILALIAAVALTAISAHAIRIPLGGGGGGGSAPIATETTPGIVKPGTGLTIEADGTLNNTGVSGVATFNGRGGAVKPGFSDYSASMIKRLAPVARLGTYTSLTGKPIIPAAQVPSDWNASSGVARILNKPTIPTTLAQLSEDSTHRTVTDAQITEWDANSAPVTSVFGRTGDVTAQAGDYTAADVGADALGSATSVQSNLDDHVADTANPHSVTATQLTSGTLDGDRLPAPSAKRGGVTSAEMAAKLSTTGTAYDSDRLGGTAAATVVAGAAAGATALQPNGNGSALTGITAGQISGLGTAATTAATDYATAAQGVTADNTSADEVFAINYNGGTLSHVAINQSITAIGSAVKTLVITPGTWPMSNHVTVPANITLRVMPGAVIDHTAGVLTINGPLIAPRQMWLDNFEYPNLVFGKLVNNVYVDWVDAAGDGTTADQVPLRAILEASAYKDVYFNGSKTYNLTATLTAGYPTAIKIHGHGATLKSAVSDGTALSIGGWAASYTGQSITVTKGSNTFTIPGGVTVAVGDMIRLTAGTEYVPGYKYGVLTNVVKVDGSTATIDILSVYDFTATDLVVFTRTDDVEVEGLVFDNTGSTKDTNGLIVQGRNAYIHDNIAKGSEAAGIGLQFLGIGGKMEHNRTYDYLSKYSGAGGRYGDGIGVSGHNIEVVRNKLYNHKHALTISVREFATNTVTVRGNTFAQDPSRFGETFVQGGNTKYLYSGVVDIHGDAENVVFENNEIDGAGFALATIRNGRAVFRDNRMRMWNNTATGIGIFHIGETTLRSLVLSGNEIEAETASTALMSEADGSWLHQIAVASPVYTNGIDVDVKQDGTNVLTNVTTTTAFPTLAGNTPSTPCQNDQLWVDSNATSGQRIYACEAGSWVLQGDGGGSVVSDTAYAASWDGVTAIAPSKNAVYDKIEALVAGGGMVYPGAGVANSTGSAWGTSYTVGTGASNLVQLDGSSRLPAVNGSLLTNLPNQLSASSIAINATSTSNTAGVGVSRGNPDMAAAARYNLLSVSQTVGTSAPNASSELAGIEAFLAYNGSGTMPNMYGVFVSSRNTGVGTINNLYGVQSYPRNSSTGIVYNIYGVNAETPINAGTIGTSVVGVRSANQGISGVANTYGIKVENQSGGTNSYSIYTGTSTSGASFGDFVNFRNVSAPSNIADSVRVYNVEGDYLHIKDEDGNDHTIGQGTINVGDTAQSTVNASKLGGQAGSYYAPLNGATHTQGTSTTLDLNANDGFRITAASGLVTLTVNNLVDGKYFDIEIISSSGPLSLNNPLFTGSTFLNGVNSNVVEAGKKSHYVCKGNGSGTALCYILAESKP